MDRMVPRALLLAGYVGVALLVFWPAGREPAVIGWLIFGLGAYGIGRADARHG